MKLEQQAKMKKCLMMLSLRVQGFEEEEGPAQSPFSPVSEVKVSVRSKKYVGVKLFLKRKRWFTRSEQTQGYGSRKSGTKPICLIS